MKAILRIGLLSVAHLLPAQIFVVDCSGGPGTDFTSIRAAVAAVPDGARLLVRPGIYQPFVVDGTSRTGMPVLYEPPTDVGADRIVNGVAAFELYGRPAGTPTIVVDFGTATTFDAISKAGEYLGGVICPGIQISADALFQRAARLPKVDVRKPARVVGRTTVGSIQAGLFFGYVDMVIGIVRRMRDELAGPGGAVATVATGGTAAIIAEETGVIDTIDPDLTLVGLRMIWERNQA